MTVRLRLRRSVLALVALVACASKSASSTGQILLYVDTDAPMASASNAALGPTDPLPLFDRVRIDVYAPGATAPCDQCSNDFGLDADQLRAGASVGLVPAPGVAGYRARVRLYLAAFASPLGEPDANTTIDVTVSLAVTAPVGIVDQTVLLKTDDVGKPVGSLVAPLSPTLGRPGSSAVGTWGPATRVPCSGTANPGEVCIPGGAYWMGNPLAVNVVTDDEGTQPRLVVVSPYFLDETEVTVERFRAAGRPPGSTWSTGTFGTAWSDWCTYAATPRPCSLGFPCEQDVLNCVTWAEARAFCQGEGGDLPTEAQYEYAAGGLQSQLYVWGEDTPVCGDAKYGAGDGAGNGALVSNLDEGCPAPGFGGPVPAGAGTLDRLTMQGGVVVDLAGNLEEWAQDLWNRQDEPCWSDAGIYTDPLCGTPSPADGIDHPIRGAGWIDGSLDLHAATRAPEGHGGEGSVSADQADVDVGFRCARPATR